MHLGFGPLDRPLRGLKIDLWKHPNGLPNRSRRGVENGFENGTLPRGRNGPQEAPKGPQVGSQIGPKLAPKGFKNSGRRPQDRLGLPPFSYRPPGTALGPPRDPSGTPPGPPLDPSGTPPGPSGRPGPLRDLFRGSLRDPCRDRAGTPPGPFRDLSSPFPVPSPGLVADCAAADASAVLSRPRAGQFPVSTPSWSFWPRGNSSQDPSGTLQPLPETLLRDPWESCASTSGRNPQESPLEGLIRSRRASLVTLGPPQGAAVSPPPRGASIE